MKNLEFELSINKNIIGKGDPRSPGWVKVKLDAQSILNHVSQGIAFTGGVLKPKASVKKPSTSDIVGADLIAIDIDNTVSHYNKDTKKYDKSKKTESNGYLSWENCINDSWLRKNALFIYTTPSHTEDHHRLRIVFAFTNRVTDANEYFNIAAGLIDKYGADPSCKNIERISYGNKDCKYHIYGDNTLSQAMVDAIKIEKDKRETEQKEYKQRGLNGNLTKEQVAEMLSHIPAQMEYIEWFGIVSAVGNYFDEATAISLIDEWSPDTERGTKYRIQNRGEKFGIGTVVYHAKNYGFDTSILFPDSHYSKYEVTNNGSLINKLTQEKEYQNTDMGNAERFVDAYKNVLRFNHTSGKWHIWNGKYWDAALKGEVYAYAKSCVRNMYDELTRLHSEEKKQNLFKHASKSESRNSISALLDLASKESNVACLQTDFDQNNYLFNTQNGTYNLKTNEFLPHKSTRMLSKVSEAFYDPEAKCYSFEDSMETIFNQDIELIKFVQRALGLTMCGAHLEEVLFFCYGTGKNGKSVFFNVLKMIFGTYFQKAPTEMLMVNQNDSIPNDIARLPAARLVTAAELPENKAFNENKVKDLTGGDPILGRFLHKEFFEFIPTHTLWIYGNHKPNIKGTDAGIWRRICMIPFTVTIPEAERRPQQELMADFEREKSGILNWVIEGWVDYQKNGLKPPKSVLKATQEYREEQDKVLEFMNECCEIASTKYVVAIDLYKKYAEFCDENKEYPLGKKKFYACIEEKDFIKSEIRNGKKKHFIGIGVRHADQQSAF